MSGMNKDIEKIKAELLLQRNDDIEFLRNVFEEYFLKQYDEAAMEDISKEILIRSSCSEDKYEYKIHIHPSYDSGKEHSHSLIDMIERVCFEWKYLFFKKKKRTFNMDPDEMIMKIHLSKIYDIDNVMKDIVEGSRVLKEFVRYYENKGLALKLVYGSGLKGSLTICISLK